MNSRTSEYKKQDLKLLRRLNSQYIQQNALQGNLENINIKKAVVEKVTMRMTANQFSIRYNGIPVITIKKNRELFEKILPPLFNPSLNRGKFPECLKTAMMVPIPNNLEGIRGEIDRSSNFSHVSETANSVEKCKLSCEAAPRFQKGFRHSQP